MHIEFSVEKILFAMRIKIHSNRFQGHLLEKNWIIEKNSCLLFSYVNENNNKSLVTRRNFIIVISMNEHACAPPQRICVFSIDWKVEFVYYWIYKFTRRLLMLLYLYLDELSCGPGKRERRP